MNSFFRRLRWLAQRPDKETQLHEELQLHLEEEAEQQQRDGLAEADARWAARRDLGNLALVEENTRAAWGWTRLEQSARDAAYGLRQVQRNPAFSAIAVATLALGIGGITAMFSAVDAVLIRRLPYADADRLVIVWDESRKSGDPPKLNPTPAEWLEWRRLNSVFTDIAAAQPAAATLSGDSEPEQVPARKTTGNLWNVLGVKPLIGRAFTEAEDWKAVRVAVISYGLWQRRYGGSPDVLGRKITVNDNPYEVIGVMPRDFYFLPARDIDIWMPASYPAWMLTSFGWHDEQVVARLKPAMTLEGAKQSMAALSLQLTAARDSTGAHSVIETPLRETLTGNTQKALVLLLSASAALLLIACVNVANLLLSRSAARGREVAVRVALGAGRGRMVAQLLTESLVLAGLGGAAGLALALPAMRFLETLVPETMGAARLTLDWRVLAFSACAALAATLTFGLAPALRGSQLVPQDALRSGGRGMAGARHHWFQHSLIVIETALAVVLLTSGGLLTQTIQHLRKTDLGLRSEKLLTFETPLFRRDFNQRLAFVNAVLEKIRAIPGIVNASATNQFPLTVNNTHATFYLLAGQPSERSHDQRALMRTVTRDYLQTIGAKLCEGRFFDSSDRRSESPVAIVSESFVNRNFPRRSAIGARFQYGQINEKGYWYTIVGVVKEIREVGIAEDSRPTVYRVLEQDDQIGVAPPSGIVVRTSVEPSSIVSAIRQAVWSVDKNQPIWHVRTLDAILDNQLSTPAQSTMLMTAFAMLALLL